MATQGGPAEESEAIEDYIVWAPRENVKKALDLAMRTPIGRRCKPLDDLALAIAPGDAAYAISVAQEFARKDYRNSLITS